MPKFQDAHRGPRRDRRRKHVTFREKALHRGTMKGGNESIWWYNRKADYTGQTTK